MGETFKSQAEGDLPTVARKCRQPHWPHVACPHYGSFQIKLQKTGESGFLAPRNGVKCAGRWEGLEAGTDPQTILAAG